jgi:hypothetical protein
MPWPSTTSATILMWRCRIETVAMTADSRHVTLTFHILRMYSYHAFLLFDEQATAATLPYLVKSIMLFLIFLCFYISLGSPTGLFAYSLLLYTFLTFSYVFFLFPSVFLTTHFFRLPKEVKKSKTIPVAGVKTHVCVSC